LDQFYLGHMTKKLLLQDHPKLFSTYRGELWSRIADVSSSVCVSVLCKSESAIVEVLK
jgi:hypothetical protein